MERECCLRCGGKMVHIGQEKLQLGQYGVPFGHWDQLFSGALEVDIYCCRACKKLEFYAVEAPEVSSPVIKCKKTPRKKCSFVAEEAKKR